MRLSICPLLIGCALGPACNPTASPKQPDPSGSAAMAPSGAAPAASSAAAEPTVSYKELGSSVVDLLSQGKNDKVRALLSADMAKAIGSDEAVAQLWSGIQAKVGNYKRTLATTEKEKDGYHVILVTCEFDASPMDVKLVFDKERRLAGFFLVPTTNPDAFGPRPQTPKPPFDYETREVSYDNDADKTHFAGTLTMPKGAGPFPVVLLITGSGTQDRDETIFGHKPFLVIADQLTKNGFAVLRVDDPGAGGSTSDVKNATIELHARDAEAGIAFLKGQKEIDPKHIGLIGHSEGGIIAAVVGSRSKDVAFIVSLAGTGLSGAEINPLQIEAILRADGKMKEEGIKAIVEGQRKLMKLIAKDAGDKELGAAVKEAFAAAMKYAASDEDKAAAQKELAPAMEMLNHPWFKSFVKLDPAGYWSKVTVPVLALNGDKDTQVNADKNLAAIKSALGRAKNKDVEAEKLAGLNPLFQPAQSGLLDEYGKIEQTFDAKALDLLTTWLKQRANVQ